jgi:CRP/FNR family cyclic AMP-dependent transcriptional regulator
MPDMTAANGVYVESGVPIVEADPALASELGPELAAPLAESLRADVLHLNAGVWDPHEVDLGPQPHLGMLVIDGVMEREVHVAGRSAAELLGPGDILRPWDVVDPLDSCVPVDAGWTILAPSRVALLDAATTAGILHSPELTMVLVSRTLNRARSLAALLAIAQIRRLDDRTLTLLWHLADRFGRVRSDGVALEVPLRHSTIAKLLAATRPSVSSALMELANRGEIERMQGGGWLLKGSPPAIPAD